MTEMPRLIDLEGDDLGEIIAVEWVDHYDDDGNAPESLYLVRVKSPKWQT